MARKLVRHKHLSSFRPPEGPQRQTSITSRREAGGPKYHVAASNGLEPIQATEAWRIAGQEETGTANIQESRSGSTGEGVHPKLRRLQSGVNRWVSEEKVLEVEGGTQFLHEYFGLQEGDRWTQGWCGEVRAAPLAGSVGQERQEAPRLTQPNVGIASLHQWEHSYTR